MKLNRSCILVALAAATLVTACKGGKGGDDCKAAAANYATLLREAVERDAQGDDAKKAQALSLIPSLKEEMAKTCEREKWPSGTRSCIVSARSQGDLEHCMAARPEDKAADKPEDKAADRPEDKAADKPEDKAADKPEDKAAPGTP